MENQTLTKQPQQQATTHNTIAEMCLWLYCSHEMYCRIQYKYGLAYLQWYLPCDQEAKDILERSAIYWAWFRRQWELFDQVLLEDAEFFMESIKERQKTYKLMHDPQQMAREIKPSKLVLAELKKKEVQHEL